MSDLLPYNATPQERALSIAASRGIGTPIRDVWNPDTCPPELLAWLAWAFSVDQWDNAWTDAQKRSFIKSSVEVHRRKGTIGAVRDALAALFYDVRIQEWFNQTPAGDPYTFSILLEADQVGIGQDTMRALFEVVERTKNLRSHLTNVEVSVRSVAGPCVVVAAGIGSDLCLTNFIWSVTVINEYVLVI